MTVLQTLMSAETAVGFKTTNLCLSPLTLLRRDVFDTTLCCKVYDLRQIGGFLRGTAVSSTNKTDRHDITEILLKVALSTITLTQM